MVVRNYSKPVKPVPPPGLWRRFVQRPQQVWLRKALFQIHLWTGILVGLYIIAIGISGRAAQLGDPGLREASQSEGSNRAHRSSIGIRNLAAERPSSFDLW